MGVLTAVLYICRVEKELNAEEGEVAAESSSSSSKSGKKRFTKSKSSKTKAKWSIMIQDYTV